MKASTLLLVGSIAVNLVFGAVAVLVPATVAGRAPSNAPTGQKSGAAPKSAAPATGVLKPAGDRAKPERELWDALQADDLRTLIARLQAAGFPPAAIRAVVTTQIDARLAARLTALSRTGETVPYWKLAPTSDPKFMLERNQIYRERSQLLRELVGSESGSYFADPTVEQRRRYGDLPAAKVALLERINADYNEMTAEVRALARNIVLPEDRDKLELLEREKNADFAAMLTPQELADYQLRNSTALQRLRTPLTLLDASEQEFRTIYELHQKYADILYPAIGGFGTPELRQRQLDVTAQIEAAIKASFGEARAAEYTRAMHYEFQQLAGLAQREGRPLTAAVEAFNLRTSVSEESARIGNDRSLTPDQKRAAMQTLAQNARSQLTSALGPSGEGYARSSDWLRAIENGTVVTFSGNTTSFRPLPPANAPGR